MSLAICNMINIYFNFSPFEKIVLCEIFDLEVGIMLNILDV